MGKEYEAIHDFSEKKNTAFHCGKAARKTFTFFRFGNREII